MAPFTVLVVEGSLLNNSGRGSDVRPLTIATEDIEVLVIEVVDILDAQSVSDEVPLRCLRSGPALALVVQATSKPRRTRKNIAGASFLVKREYSISRLVR
jgi:hypothetical protein